jgi:hypothetical protein
LNIEIVVAELSAAQPKCTNILAALAIDRDDAPVVLLDADITPQPWWLAMLVAPLATGPPTSSAAIAGWCGGTHCGRRARHRSRSCRFGVGCGRRFMGGSLAATRHALDTSICRPAIRRAPMKRGPADRRRATEGQGALTRRAVRLPTPVDGGFGRSVAIWATTISADTDLPLGIVVLPPLSSRRI